MKIVTSNEKFKQMKKLLAAAKYKQIIIGSIIIGIGLGLGSIGTLFILSNNHPSIIIKEKWKTITTVPTTQPALGHSSLNPDELSNLLKIEGQPGGVAGITTTTSTTKPPVSSTTQTSLPAPTTTVQTQPPSTLPPSLPTSTSGTTNPPTTINTQPPTTVIEPTTTSSTN